MTVAHYDLLVPVERAHDVVSRRQADCLILDLVEILSAYDKYPGMGFTAEIDEDAGDGRYQFSRILPQHRVVVHIKKDLRSPK